MSHMFRPCWQGISQVVRRLPDCISASSLEAVVRVQYPDLRGQARAYVGART